MNNASEDDIRMGRGGSLAYPLTTLQGRPLIVPGTIAIPQLSYTTHACIGGLVEIATGLAAGTVISMRRLILKQLTAKITTGQPVFALFFDQNPTGSTFTDSVTFALAAADLAKVSVFANPVVAQQVGGVSNWNLLTSATLMTVDANGKIYMAISSGGASLVFSAIDVPLSFRAELFY